MVKGRLMSEFQLETMLQEMLLELLGKETKLSLEVQLWLEIWDIISLVLMELALTQQNHLQLQPFILSVPSRLRL